MIRNYQQAMDYIEEKMKLGSVPGLDNILELLHRMGNPEKKMKVLHIAGTNGKGSVFSFVQTTLVTAGYKIGRYVSPTVMDYLERFQMSDKGSVFNMPQEVFAALLDEVAEKVDEMVQEGMDSPTAFEIETAVAYLYFAREEVDYALIECGMGGRLDATNVTEKSYMSVITSIDFDHMQFLGDTLGEIAYEKAGIIKPDSICISAPQPPEVEAVILSRCEELNTKLIMVDASDIECINMDETGTAFSYKGKTYNISLSGEYQLINAGVAIEVLSMLKELGADLIDISIGLSRTNWPGRFTIKSKNPLVIIDGAHNEAAWRMLAKTLNKHFTNRQFIFIIGVLKDKEYKRMVEILSPYVRYAIAITPDSPRALPKEELIKVLETFGLPCDYALDVQDAYKMAFNLLEEKKGDSIMICGSLSFLKPYLEYQI